MKLFSYLIIIFLWQSNLSGQIISKGKPEHFPAVRDTVQNDQLDSLHQVVHDKLDAILDSTHIEVELDVLTKSLYFGRRFGFRGMLYNPKFTYYHKYGFGFSIINYVWNKGSPKFSITDFNLSYGHTINSWWEFNLDYIYWIFYQDFPSSLGWNNQIEYTNSFLIKGWLTANTGMVYMFGSETGFILQQSFTHAFYLYPATDFQRIVIEPETGFYMGNDNIYRLPFDSEKDNFNSSHIFDILDYYALLKLSARYNRYILGFSCQIDFPHKTAKDINFSTKPIVSFSLNFLRFFKI